MNRSSHTGHGILGMVIGCGLMFVAIAVLSSLGGSWATGIVLIAVLICPLSMLLLMRATGGHAHGDDEVHHEKPH